MGYEHKVTIAKKGGATDFDWLGEKNLMTYDAEFQKYLLQDTEHYYKNMASKWFKTVSCYEYVLNVHKNLTKEESNADFWLQDQTKPMVVKIVLDEAIVAYAPQIVEMNQGCSVMFNERKPEELKLIYEVFLRVDKTLTYIIKKMEPFIIAEGEKIVLN